MSKRKTEWIKHQNIPSFMYMDHTSGFFFYLHLRCFVGSSSASRDNPATVNRNTLLACGSVGCAPECSDVNSQVKS